MKTLNRDDVMTIIKAAITKAGSQAAFARESKISTGYLSDIMTGRKELSKAILDAVGIEQVPAYRRKGK